VHLLLGLLRDWRKKKEEKEKEKEKEDELTEERKRKKKKKKEEKNGYHYCQPCREWHSTWHPRTHLKKCQEQWREERVESNRSHGSHRTKRWNFRIKKKKRTKP